MFFTYVGLLENFSALTAGLRRSFRLSRKDHQDSTKESRPAESTESEFLIYEEVTLYQMRPQDKPRLVVLIGKIQGMSGLSKWVILLLAFRISSLFFFLCRISWCSNQWAETEGDCWESSSVRCRCATWVYLSPTLETVTVEVLADTVYQEDKSK